MTRPGWQYSTQDATPQLVNGSVRAWSFLSTGATAPLTITFKNLTGTKAGSAPAVPKPVTQPSQPVLVTPTNTPSAVATVVKPSIPVTQKPTPGTGGSGGTGGGGSSSGTGVPSGTDLKVHNGDLVVTKDGATYTGSTSAASSTSGRPTSRSRTR
jgi:hypothetical protein